MRWRSGFEVPFDRRYHVTTLFWPWFGGNLEVEVEFQSLDCSENQASSQYLGEHNIRNFNIWSDIATIRSAKAVINSLFKQSNGQKSTS